MNLIAIDPGISGCGVAVFDEYNKELILASYVENDVQARGEKDVFGWRVYNMASALKREFQWTVLAWVFELPQVYAGKRGSVADDLMPLAMIGACLMGRLAVIPTMYRPHQWKGSIDGLVMTVRIRERLSDEEFSRIVFPKNSCTNCRSRIVTGEKICLKPGSCLAHNVFDAAGLGLFHLGRLERKRVIAR